MDPLSVSATIVGLIPVFITAIQQTKTFYTNLTQPKELIKQLLDELVALHGNLESLEELLGSDAIKAKGVHFDRSSVLVSCSAACKPKLESLCETLQRYASNPVRRLAWPLVQKQCEESLQILRNFAFWIQLSLSVEGCRLLSRSSAEVSETLARQFSDLKRLQDATEGLQKTVEKQTRILKDSRQEQERREILEWISDLDHEKRHLEARRHRVENTGQWILEHPSFAEWRDGADSDSILWCHGLPGAGKTVLTSVVIDDLLSLSVPEASVSYFYLKYLDHGSQTLSTVLASLLRQALYGIPEIPSSITELFRNHRESSKNMGTADHLRLMLDVAVGSRTSFIVLDALDEYDQSQRRSLLKAIHDLKQCQSIRILLTSRSHIPDIEASLGDCTQIAIQARDDDLKAYMQQLILEQNEYDIIDEDFANHIMEQVISRANGTFLPVVLQLGTILRKKTRGHMEDAIGSISDDLGVVFEETMARVDQLHDDYRLLAKRVLAWVTHAKSPLTVDELGDALSVTDCVKRGLKSWNTRYRPSPKMMINCCQGLVVMEPATNRLNLAHYTVQEHFEKHTERLFPHAKEDFALTCLSYLLYEDFQSGPCDTDQVPDRVRKYPFLAHAALHWGKHVAKTEQEPAVADSLSRFLGQRNATASAWQVLRYTRGYISRYWQPTECISVTPLHIASRFGLIKTLAGLLKTNGNRDINQCTALVKSTPIIMAASEASLETLGLLLRNDADPTICNWYGNALHCACESGMSDNIQLLVEFGMEANVEPTRQHRWRSSRSKYPPPPILCTLDNDKVGAFQTLVELAEATGNDVSKVGMDSDPHLLQCLLVKAVEYGAYSIVDWLLQNTQHRQAIRWLLRSRYLDLYIAMPEYDGKAPFLGPPVLREAIFNADAEMVRLLVSRGADPYAKDKYGRTAVDYAAESGVNAFSEALDGGS